MFGASVDAIPGSPSVSAYEIFAENLISLVHLHGTIADACRAMGLNRQQFNKYLSGQVLPSRENLEVICRHFKVDSQSLFQSKLGNNTASPISGGFASLAAQDAAAQGLVPGLYWLYGSMPVLGSPVERILISVQMAGNTKQLKGIRRIGYINQSISTHKPSVIDGAAMQNGNRLSIVFRELATLTRWGMVSIMVGEQANIDLQVGVLSTYLPNNAPFATAVVTQFITHDISIWRSAYRRTGFMKSPVDYDEHAVAATKLLSKQGVSGFFIP
jgi:hypothetical protein